MRSRISSSSSFLTAVRIVSQISAMAFWRISVMFRSNSVGCFGMHSHFRLLLRVICALINPDAEIGVRRGAIQDSLLIGVSFRVDQGLFVARVAPQSHTVVGLVISLLDRGP